MPTTTLWVLRTRNLEILGPCSPHGTAWSPLEVSGRSLQQPGTHLCPSPSPTPSLGHEGRSLRNVTRPGVQALGWGLSHWLQAVSCLSCPPSSSRFRVGSLSQRPQNKEPALEFNELVTQEDKGQREANKTWANHQIQEPSQPGRLLPSSPNRALVAFCHSTFQIQKLRSPR